MRLSAITKIVLPLLALQAASAHAQETAAPPSPPPPPAWDMVVFEMKSWGEPVISWRITSQGGGSWTETERGERLGQYTLAWHEIEPAIDRYIALERILGQLPEQAPDSSQCTDFMTDQPYGTIRLTRGATTLEHAYNAGCMDDSYAGYLSVLRNANDLVALWGRGAPVLRRESFGEANPPEE